MSARLIAKDRFAGMGRRILRVLCINVALAVLPSASYLAFEPNPVLKEIPEWIGYALVYSNCIGILASIVFAQIGGWLYRFPLRVRWTLILALLIVIGLIGSAIATSILHIGGWVKAADLKTMFLYGAKFSTVLTLIFGVVSFLFREYREKLEETTLSLRTRELEKERAEKLIGEARLASLESRIHPHFLFNALNSVAALIRDDPQRAEEQIERISRFLRFALDRATSRLVTVGEEVKIVGDYLEIEHTRFGNRLRYSISVAPGVSDQKIPPFSVQTLVENSIKHTVARRRQGGEIRVSVQVEDSRLRAEVWDDGGGFDPDSRPAGHGLDLLEGRLTAQFGDSARLHFTNGHGMKVAMEIPCVHS